MLRSHHPGYLRNVARYGIYHTHRSILSNNVGSQTSQQLSYGIRLASTSAFHTESSIQATGPQDSTQETQLARARSVGRIKYPQRGGQNLSARYRRLERMLRGKEAYTQRAEDAKQTVEAVARQEDGVDERGTKRTFMGFTIPEEPKPPESDECCMSGCAICVYDLYNESLDAYTNALSSIRDALAARRVPESTWPPELHTSGSPTLEKPTPQAEVVLSAFEELEARLKKKHQDEDKPRTGLDPGARDFARWDASARMPVVTPARRRKEKVDVRALYEGIRWFLFSNR
ncbi:hypothetical protein CERSUDRAFT_140517 [Gelatoporia subvermispora B]|uniref:Oxidoreductase-like domain-containing protein n=1 Tax=Ceriporiopsis subvermispora (strain B) TaxID=914234 RepID=M2R8S9_CERS8|nr:hypothetical protein CERSUDRAFT_140517 [Gelatoporia subvermispora B]